ncbi:MAG TPA: PEP-CTERM sorting domain-containing protein [Myxococcota bacterium]|nr:PEP-CTERM sorting domain-containing protein [Myxococcota bacterium]
MTTAAFRHICVFSLLLLAAPGWAVGSTTHVDFNLSHTERIANSNVVLTDSNLPGLDGTTQIDDTGSIAGTYGDHTISVFAAVEQPSGLTKLRARGEHTWDVSGLNLTTDQWRTVNGTQTLRAAHADEIQINGAPFVTLTVEMYWDVRGTDDALIDINIPQSVVYDFDNTVTLTGTTVAPNSGGGSFTKSVLWPGGMRTQDLNQEKVLEPDDGYVKMTYTVAPGQDLAFTTTFEVKPTTFLSNTFEGFALDTSCVGHRDLLFDQSAELVGVIVRDNGGFVVPGISITSDSGNLYPLLEEVPTPPPPPRVILSPVAATTDLGEYDATTPVTKMLDQSGLSKPFTSGVTSFDGYFDFNPVPLNSGTTANTWNSLVDFTLPLTGNVDFDLGGTQAFDRIALWNKTLQNIRIQISDSPGGPWTEIGQYSLPNHWNFLSYPADVLDLGGLHTASHLRIAIDSAHKYSASDTFTYAIVGEVAVSAIPVPEPEHWLMLLAGAPTVALLGRWRRRRGSDSIET